MDGPRALAHPALELVALVEDKEVGVGLDDLSLERFAAVLSIRLPVRSTALDNCGEAAEANESEAVEVSRPIFLDLHTPHLPGDRRTDNDDLLRLQAPCDEDGGPSFSRAWYVRHVQSSALLVGS